MAVQAHATAKYVRTSAQKAGLVMDLIRGRDVNAALATLKFARKGVARDIEKVLRSAIANATQKEGFGGVVDMYSSVAGFLVGEGIGEATDVLLIDEKLCIGCDNCEKACADSHDGLSRLDREAGPTVAMIHVPTSCRHCEHPHCMADCPPNAIKRGPDGEVFIDETCIGCGNCQRNCPYGVIRMDAKPPKKPGLLSWMFLGLGPGPGEASYSWRKKKAESQGKEVPKVAIKCDMCFYACRGEAQAPLRPNRFLDLVASA